MVPWWKRETVRVRGYSVSVAVIGVLVLREYVSNEEAAYILMAVAALLGVYGVESSRSKTTTDAEVEKIIGEVQHEERVWPFRPESGVTADETAADYPPDWEQGSSPKH